MSSTSSDEPSLLDRLRELAGSEPEPLFIVAWTKDIALGMLTFIVGDIMFAYLSETLTGLNAADIWYLSTAVFGLIVPLALDRGGALKVREIRFYDDSIEVRGYRFKSEYSYEDVSRLELTKRRPAFLGDALVFAIKYESGPFRSANPRNGELGTDLYTWMSVKVPRSALKVPKSAPR